MPRGKSGQLNAERLRDLARAGAQMAVKQLRAELVAIERTFPELALSKSRRAVRRSIKQAAKKTTRMSVAARKAVSASSNVTTSVGSSSPPSVATARARSSVRLAIVSLEAPPGHDRNSQQREKRWRDVEGRDDERRRVVVLRSDRTAAERRL